MAPAVHCPQEMPAQELPLPSPAVGKTARPGDAGPRVGSDSRVYSASSGAPCSLRGEKQDLVCDPWESSLTPQGARGLRLIPSLLARGAGLCLQMLHKIGLCRAMPCHLCLQLFCWVGFDQEQAVLGLSPGHSYCCLGFGFLITHNMRSLPRGVEGLLANITSHFLGSKGLQPRGLARSRERDTNHQARTDQGTILLTQGCSEIPQTRSILQSLKERAGWEGLQNPN